MPVNSRTPPSSPAEPMAAENGAGHPFVGRGRPSRRSACAWIRFGRVPAGFTLLVGDTGVESRPWSHSSRKSSALAGFDPHRAVARTR